MNDLRDKVVIITGAGSGIGRAIALLVADQGGLLGLIGRKIGPLNEVADKAKTTSPRAVVYAVDLNEDDALMNMSEKVRMDFGKVDILVHSAGYFSMGKVQDARVADFDIMYRTNLRAPFLLTQTMLDMIVKAQGQIVFINSTAGVKAQEKVSQYAATKHGLRAVADSLRDEVNPLGVRVLSVYPGRTATPMQKRIFQMEQRAYDPVRLLQPQDVASMVLDAVCMPRTAEMTDFTIRPFLKP